MEVSGKFLADRYDVHPTTIQRWAKDGVIEKVDRDRYVLESADLYFIGELQKEIKKLSTSPDSSFVHRKLLAECRKLEAQAEIEEIELEQLKNTLISKEEALRDVKHAFSRIKAKMLAIPSKTALELSGLNDPISIQRLLEGACDEVLSELHGEFLNYNSTE